MKAGTPMKNEDVYLSCAFPWLFPYGIGDRHPPKKRARLVKHFLRFNDHRFENDTKFCMTLFNQEQRRKIHGVLKVVCERGSNVSDTLKEIRKAAQERQSSGTLPKKTMDILMEKLVPYSSAMKGTEPYYRQGRRNILAMLDDPSTGTPCWFVTLSGRDFETPDLAKALGESEQTATSAVRKSLLNSHPALAATLADRRYQIVFDVVLEDGQALGEVKDYFIRAEWQHRGSLHWHIILFSPIQESDDKVEPVGPDKEKGRNHKCATQDEDQHVSAAAKRLLKRIQSVPLVAYDEHGTQANKSTLAAATAGIFAWNTTHADTCTKEGMEHLKGCQGPMFHDLSKCKRYKRKDKTGTMKSCGHNYPRSKTGASWIKKRGTRLISNPVSNNGLMVSSHPTVLRADLGNCDTTPIDHQYGVAAYTAYYVSKQEPETVEALQTLLGSLPENTPIKTVWQKVLMNALGITSTSSQQACHIMLGLDLIKTSRPVKPLFIPTRDYVHEALVDPRTLEDKPNDMQRYLTRTFLAPDKDLDKLKSMSFFEWKRGKDGVVDIRPPLNFNVDEDPNAAFRVLCCFKPK